MREYSKELIILIRVLKIKTSGDLYRQFKTTVDLSKDLSAHQYGLYLCTVSCEQGISKMAQLKTFFSLN